MDKKEKLEKRLYEITGYKQWSEDNAMFFYLNNSVDEALQKFSKKNTTSNDVHSFMLEVLKKSLK